MGRKTYLYVCMGKGGPPNVRGAAEEEARKQDFCICDTWMGPNGYKFDQPSLQSAKVTIVYTK